MFSSGYLPALSIEYISRVRRVKSTGALGRPPALPDEILVKIARACIKPYSLMVLQKLVSVIERNGTFHREDEIVRYSDPGKVLVVRSFSQFTDPRVYDAGYNNIDILSGLPNMLNIKLTNRLFYQAITKTIEAQFSGRVNIRESYLARGMSKRRISRAYLDIYHGQKFRWLMSLITEITIVDDGGRPNLAMTWPTRSPNLRVLRLKTKGRWAKPEEMEALASSLRGRVLAAIRVLLTRSVGNWLDISSLHQRRVDVKVNMKVGVELYCGKPSDDAYVFDVDLPFSGPVVIRNRQKISYTHEALVDKY